MTASLELRYAAMRPFEIREAQMMFAPEIWFTSEVRYCRTETVSSALNTTPLSLVNVLSPGTMDPCSVLLLTLEGAWIGHCA